MKDFLSQLNIIYDKEKEGPYHKFESLYRFPDTNFYLEIYYDDKERLSAYGISYNDMIQEPQGIPFEIAFNLLPKNIKKLLAHNLDIFEDLSDIYKNKK